MTSMGLMAAGVALGGASIGAPEPSEPSRPETEFDVRDFGARGDGVTDDTKPIQAAIDAAVKLGASAVRIPSGRYRITRSLTIGSAGRLDIIGSGYSSTLLHECDEPCFHWKAGGSCVESSVRELCIASTTKDKSPDVAAIHCEGGLERSFFGRIYIRPEGANVGSGIITERVADTSALDHCLIYGVHGTGVRVARGSEVRIFGGRIIGGSRDKECYGVHLVGNNGGVHIVTTDLIALGTGLRIGSEGGDSNREVFITHATFDGCIRGIHQTDGAYTSIAGCWAASSADAQILIDKSAAGAIMTIAGGTIFNGGATGGEGGRNGIVVRAGSFVISGVTIRNNQGVGLLVDGDSVSDYSVTGCRIVSNGTGAVLAGNHLAFTGNVLRDNGVNFIDRAGDDKQINGNVIPREIKE